MSSEGDREEAGLEGEILAAERRRFGAMIERDLDALDGLLAEDLTYTHTSGKAETKAEFLATLEFGTLRYERIEPRHVMVRPLERAAVVTATSRMWLRVDGKAVDFWIRYLAVYVRRGEKWQLLAWQSTRLPEQAETD